jgi:hypothetical protein
MDLQQNIQQQTSDSQIDKNFCSLIPSQNKPKSKSEKLNQQQLDLRQTKKKEFVLNCTKYAIQQIYNKFLNENPNRSIDITINLKFDQAEFNKKVNFTITHDKQIIFDMDVLNYVLKFSNYDKVLTDMICQTIDQNLSNDNIITTYRKALTTEAQQATYGLTLTFNFLSVFDDFTKGTKFIKKDN